MDKVIIKDDVIQIKAIKVTSRYFKNVLYKYFTKLVEQDINKLMEEDNKDESLA